MSEDVGWYDEAAGPLVRPYTITSGRTPDDSARLDLSTQVMATRSEREPTGLGPEHLAIKRLCRKPVAIAEIAAHMKVPVGVVRVLLADLIERGVVITRSPIHNRAKTPDLETLQAVLNGLVKL